jgi:hypothetical protein
LQEDIWNVKEDIGVVTRNDQGTVVRFAKDPIFFSTPNRLDDSGVHHLLIQWIPEDLYPEVKRPICEDNYPPPFNIEVTNA